jgi:hypothetical protein
LIQEAEREKFSTPQARDYKGATGANWNHETLPDQIGGPLNPMWVAWLMGFPIEWINCDV